MAPADQRRARRAAGALGAPLLCAAALGATLLCAAALGACGSEDEGAGLPGFAEAGAESATPADAADASTGDANLDAWVGAPLEGGTYLYTLEAGAFPGSGHPDVAVHVPPGLRPFERVGAVVFFHGFNNCVANVIGSVNSACVTGSPVRTALHLSEQLDAARVNAILFAVELRYDQATGDPGALASPNRLRELLHETLAGHLDAVLGRPLDVGDLERVIVGTHSGGYQAAARTITVGGLPQLRQIDLYDSLYGELPTYDAWIQGHVARYDVGRADELRFSDVYTSGGGTAVNSRAMATRIQGWLAPVGLQASLIYDDTTATLAPADLADPLIMKLSGLTHDGVPQYYFGRMVSSAGFAPLP
jgi:hypothetical protein